MRNQTPYSQFCAFPFPSHFANLADIPCAPGRTRQVALGEVCYEHTHIESLFSLLFIIKKSFLCKAGNSCKPLWYRRHLWVWTTTIQNNCVNQNFLAVCLPLFSVVADGLSITFVARRCAACLIHLDFLFGRLFYTKPLVARRGFEPLVFRMKIWCPRPLDERAIIKDLFFSIFPDILIRRKPNRPRLCYRYKSCKTFNECDPSGARTQDPDIKSVVL